MKRVLIQLDTDIHASAFDAIVASDAGAEVILSYSRAQSGRVEELLENAVLARRSNGISHLAVCIGGSDVDECEQLLARVRSCFMGEPHVSVLFDPNGCNTTSAAALATLRRRVDLKDQRVAVVGLGPLGLRSATLLRKEGANVLAISIPRDLVETTNMRYRPQQGPSVARRLEFEVQEPNSRRELERSLSLVSAVVCAAPAAIQVLRNSFWMSHPTIRTLVDFNAAAPLGVEPSPDGPPTGFVLLDAFEIGRLKMRLHKQCLTAIFEQTDIILDTEQIFDIARTLFSGGPVLGSCGSG